MDAFILAGEELTKFVTVGLVQVAEALANVPVEWQVGPILHAALNHHVAQLDLLTWTDL